MLQNEFCLFSLRELRTLISSVKINSSLSPLPRKFAKFFFFFFLVSHLKAEYAPPLEKSHQTMTIPRIMNRALVVTFSVDIVTFCSQCVRVGYFYRNARNKLLMTAGKQIKQGQLNYEIA